MNAETDLSALLARLAPVLHGERYAFAEGDARDDAFAIIRETEGLTVIAAAPDGEWARISLGVHSSLAAVGLTAALATALAACGIPANMIAGLRHDHIFVPWDRRDAAMAALAGL